MTGQANYHKHSKMLGFGQAKCFGGGVYKFVKASAFLIRQQLPKAPPFEAPHLSQSGGVTSNSVYKHNSLLNSVAGAAAHQLESQGQ